MSQKKHEVFTLIKEEKPRMLYVSGKTCTGKTTFCKKLHEELGYFHMELDKIVHEFVLKPLQIQDASQAFLTIYKDGEPAEWREKFIEETRRVMYDILKTGPLVVEGAVANPQTLQRIFSGKYELLFLYIHPSDKDIYSRQVTERFEKGIHNDTTGLPKYFWSYTSPEDVEHYKATKVIRKTLQESIYAFVKDSMSESEKRLKRFQEVFSNITVLDI